MINNLVRGGLLETIVLKIINESPANSYEVSKMINYLLKTTLKPGTISPVYYRLKKQGLIVNIPICLAHNAKTYTITTEGKNALTKNLQQVSFVMDVLLDMPENSGSAKIITEAKNNE